MAISMKVFFTDEEKEEYKKIILDSLKQGISYSEISEYLGISQTTISKMKKEL